MAKVKAPSAAQRAVVTAILNNAQQQRVTNSSPQGQWSTQRQAQNARALVPVIHKLQQQQHAPQHGGGGSILDAPSDIFHTAMNLLDIPRAAVVSGGEQFGHAVVKGLQGLGVLDEIKPPKPAKMQAANYAYSVLQDSLGSKLGRQLTPKEIDYFRQINPAVDKQFADAFAGFYKDNAQKIAAEIQQDKYLNAGPSLDAWVSGVENHELSANWLSKNMGHIDAAGNPTGAFQGGGILPTLGNLATGLVADIAVDPMAHGVVSGAADVANVMRKAQDARLAAEAAGETERAAQLAEVITKLGRTKTSAALTSEELASLGERGGYEVLGKGVGGQTLRNAIYEVNPLSKARVAIGDVLDKTVRGGNLLNGMYGSLKADLRSGEVTRAVTAADAIPAIRRGMAEAGATGNDLRKAANEALAATDLKPHEMAHAYAAAQGNKEAAALLGGGDVAKGFQRVAPINKWFTDTRQAVIDATGKDIGFLDNYVPHEITREMQARMAAGESKRASLFSVVNDRAKERTIKAGSELFGDTVPVTADTPDKVVAWANAKSKELFGHEMYKTDLTDLMKSYASWASKSIGNAKRDELLAKAGLFNVNPSVVSGLEKQAVKQANKVENLGGDLIAASRDVKTSEAALVDRASQAHEAAISFLPTNAAPQEAGAAIAAQAEKALARVPVGSPAAGSYEDAQRFAEAATHEVDPFQAGLASARSQEAFTLGKLQEQEVKLAGTYDKLSIAKQKNLNDLTGRAFRTFFDTHELDPMVQEHMRNISRALGPKSGPEWMRHYDQVVTWLKSWQVATPRFLGHITIGHTWNNFLARIEVGTYKQYWEANSAMQKSPEAWSAFQAANPEAADAYLQVSRLVKGQMGDFSAVELGEATKPKLLTLSRNQALPYYARQGGERIQHMMRVSLGMDEILNKGGSIDSALERIATYHFDYGDLSNFEKSWVKRVIPFYTWTRRNVPLQLEMLVKNPRVAQTWQDVTRNLAAQGGAPDLAVPSYFSTAGAYKLGTAGTTSIYGTSEMTPLKEPTEYLTDPKSTFLSAITPVLKVPAELAVGHQFYKDMPLSGSKQVETPLPSFLGAVLNPLLEQAGVAQRSKDGGYTMSQKNAYVLTGLLPMLATAYRASGSKPERAQNVVDAINTMTGLNLRTNTLADQLDQLKYEKAAKKKAAAAARAAKQGKVPYQITIYGKPKKK